jgi:hypothetical protein
VSACGRRCEARKRLEFDHVQAYARGGEATVAGLRLRCRAHNQYEAERTYGPEFMRHKRLAAAGARVAGRNRIRVPVTARATEDRPAAGTGEPASAAARVAAAGPAAAPAPGDAADRDVVPWRRTLGFSAAEARRAAERCADLWDAPLEERVRVALASFRVRGVRIERAPVSRGPAVSPEIAAPAVRGA